MRPANVSQVNFSLRFLISLFLDWPLACAEGWPVVGSDKKTEGSFDQPKGCDGADGVGRNVFAPCKSGLRRDVPLAEPLGGTNSHGDYRHDYANEEELPQFHADVEEKKGERDGILRESDFA